MPRLYDLVEAPFKTRLGDLRYLLLTLRIARRLRRMLSPRVRGAAVKVMVVAVVSGLVLASCTNDTSTAEPQVSDTPVAARLSLQRKSTKSGGYTTVHPMAWGPSALPTWRSWWSCRPSSQARIRLA